MHLQFVRRTIFVTTIVYLLTACDSGEQKKGDGLEPRKEPSNEEPTAATSAGMVEFFALPVSLRSGGQEPSDCIKVEMTPSSMRINGAQTVEISGGRVADSEQSGDRILKLKSAIESKPRSCLVLEVHSNLIKRWRKS